MTYIALIRGINVGGHRKIKMVDLKEMFLGMGYEKVVTYIQSGNVVFISDEPDHKKLERLIEEHIRKTFGYDVVVIIRTLSQFETLIAQNPFEGKEVDPFKLYVTFFSEEPPAERKEELISSSNSIEMYHFVSQDLFSLIDKKTDQKGNFSTNFIEKVTKTPGTMRNWNSVNKLHQLGLSMNSADL